MIAFYYRSIGKKIITNIPMMRSNSKVSPFDGLKIKGKKIFRPRFIFPHAPMSYS